MCYTCGNSLFIATKLPLKWLNILIIATENCIFVIFTAKIHEFGDAVLAFKTNYS